MAAATVAGAAANDLTDDDLDLDPPAWVNQSDADAAPGTTGVVVDDVAPVDDVAVDPDPGTDDPVPAPLVAPAAAVAPPGDETDEVAAVGAEDGEDDEGGRRRRWPWVAAIVVLAASAALGALTVGVFLTPALLLAVVALIAAPSGEPG